MQENQKGTDKKLMDVGKDNLVGKAKATRTNKAKQEIITFLSG